MKKILSLIFIAVIVLGGVGYIVFHKDKDSKANGSSQAKSSKNASGSHIDPADAITIVYSNSGFLPSTLTVKAGDTVNIKNIASHDLQFDSDPHPSHTDDKDLNVGTVQSGKSASFKAEKKGSFGYHNHLNPSDTGMIVIQ